MNDMSEQLPEKKDFCCHDTVTMDLSRDNRDNYAPVRYNAMKHGVLSTLTVLPHEDGAAFSALRAALVEEHQPLGPTELHLVEDGGVRHGPPAPDPRAASAVRRFGLLGRVPGPSPEVTS